MNFKLIKCISILLIVIIILALIATLFPFNRVQAKEQNTEDYTIGSDILDKYPGYSSMLDQLLADHPEWTFTILFTGLDWDIAVKNERAHARNLVQNERGEWICSVCGTTEYDSGWYCASTAAVSYYMDPRNSLYEDYIFQFENLKWSDGKFTIDGIESILDGCDYLLKDKITYLNTSGKTATIDKTYAEVIMEAAEAAGISPYHLASRIRQEQGTGSSASPTGSGKYGDYVGYYNFFNINASGNGDAAILNSGLAYAKDAGWTDPEKSIKGGAEFLVKEYIQYGQNTLYLQKFDVDDSDGDLYWHQYQQNVSAAKTESTSIMKAYKEIDSSLSTPFNFVIPVFENMPETRCERPGSESIVTQNIEVTAASLVVYKEKKTSSTKLKTLKKGEKLLRIEIGAEKENGQIWDKVVLSDGTKGYVVSSTGFKVIDDVTNCEITAIAVEPGNVRNGPGTSGTTTLTTLTEGQIVTIIEKDVYKNVDGYDWSRIILSDGTQGYIVARYLMEVNEEGTTTDGQEIVRVVCKEGLILRKEPGTSSAMIGQLDYGDYLTRIEKEVSNANGYIWDKVVTSDTGLTGYVARGDDDENYIEPANISGTSAIKGEGFKTSGSQLICEPEITIENILAVAKEAAILDTNNKPIEKGNLATGYKVKNNNRTYTVIKLGDVNGDGEIKATDYMRIKNYIMDTSKLTNAQLEAADVNRDGKVKATDYMKIKNYIMGTSNISL